MAPSKSCCKTDSKHSSNHSSALWTGRMTDCKSRGTGSHPHRASERLFLRSRFLPHHHWARPRAPLRRPSLTHRRAWSKACREGTCPQNRRCPFLLSKRVSSCAPQDGLSQISLNWSPGYFRKANENLKGTKNFPSSKCFPVTGRKRHFR